MKVGVLGAGQLGRMLALAGYALGFEFRFVDPNPASPAARLAPLRALAYTDPQALAFLAECDVVTFEFENVPEPALQQLEQATRVFPPPAALAVAQDRLLEKRCFQELGLLTPRFFDASDRTGLEQAADALGYPCVLKTRRFGYDGKGQRVLQNSGELEEAWQQFAGRPLILEEFVRFERELSLIGVRGRDGSIRFYPMFENRHSNGILRVSRAPANVSREMASQAEDRVRRLLEHLDYVGVLTVEFFEAGGRLLANECAPRVHNSGHLTIEAAETSQFENHLRAVSGLPLGSTELRGHAAMLNLVGELPPKAAVLQVPGAHYHDYGKEPRPERKVGHITVFGSTLDELEQRLARVEAQLS